MLLLGSTSSKAFKLCPMDHLCGLWFLSEDGLEAPDPTMTALYCSRWSVDR